MADRPNRRYVDSGLGKPTAVKIDEVKPTCATSGGLPGYTDDMHDTKMALGLTATRRFEVRGPWTKMGAILAVAEAFNIERGNAHPWSPVLKHAGFRVARKGLRTFEVVAEYEHV